MTDTDDLDETPAEANSRRANTGAAVLAHYLSLGKTDVEGMVESLEDDNGPVRDDKGWMTEILTDILADLLHYARDPEALMTAMRFAVDHHEAEVEEAKEIPP